MPGINDYLLQLPVEKRSTVEQLRALIQKAGGPMEEAIKWSYPAFLKSGKIRFVIAPHQSHANLQIYDGAALDGKFSQLEGTGKGMRHLKFAYDEKVDAKLVGAVVKAAVKQFESRS